MRRVANGPGIPGAPLQWATAGFPSNGKLGRLEIIELFTLAASLNGMNSSASGTGATFTDDETESGRIGIANCRTGTTTTGRAGVISRADTVLFGGGRHRIRWDTKAAHLSDGTDTLTDRLGFLDSISGEPTDGCYFRYTHGTNSGKWEAVTRAAGVETATDTGIAASTNWVCFEIEVNAAGTSVVFYINGSVVATNTTNIPTGGNRTGFGAGVIKSAGTNDREFRLDTMAYSFEPTSPL